MNKVKIAALLAALAALTSCLSACGDKADAPDTAASTAVSEDSPADAPEVSSAESSDDTAEENEVKWELKNLSAPDFRTEYIKVDTHCNKPIDKVRTFLDFDSAEFYASFAKDGYFSSFSSGSMCERELYYLNHFTLNEISEPIYNPLLKDSARGATVTREFCAHNKENQTIDFSFGCYTGAFNGFNTMTLEFSAPDNDKFAELSENLIRMLSNVCEREYLEYIFYGGDSPTLETELPCSDGKTTITIERTVEPDYYGNPKCRIYFMIYNTEITEDENWRVRDDAGMELIYPDKMKTSIADITCEDIGPIDMKEPAHLFQGFFTPAPVYGSVQLGTLAENFSVSQRRDLDGNVTEECYDVTLHDIFGFEDPEYSRIYSQGTSKCDMRFRVYYREGGQKTYYIGAQYKCVPFMDALASDEASLSAQAHVDSFLHSLRTLLPGADIPDYTAEEIFDSKPNIECEGEIMGQKQKYEIKLRYDGYLHAEVSSTSC